MLRCDARELGAQARLAREFHRRRLARPAPGALDERADFTQDYTTDLVACVGCDLLLRSPRPPADALRRAYVEDAYPDARLDEMRASQAALYRRKLPRLARLLGGAPRATVEVGSFVGGFLDLARVAGWPALGLDPGRQVADFCRARGLAVEQTTLEDWAPTQARASVDCIAIWNTFDQLPEPAPTLAAAAHLLRPGGVLALRMPHGPGFLRRRTGLSSRFAPTRRYAVASLAWNNLLGFPYLHGYGPRSLDRLLGAHGFRRVALEGDVLGLLAGRETADWARREERALKQLERLRIRALARRPGGLAAAPWIDAYYRRG